MPSRWQKRSQEDKERIKKEQAEQGERQEENNSKPVSHDSDSKRALTIYDKGEIPIMCPKCFCWEGSEKYILVIEKDPIGREVEMITGKCRKCGGTMKRALVSITSNISEGVHFGMCAMILKSEGRLTDKRPIKKEE